MYYNKNIQQEKLRLINERIKKHNKSIYDSKGRLLNMTINNILNFANI
jgi:hypothetical protein